MNEDEKWMALALAEAKKAEKHGEVPVGAVLVKDGLLLQKPTTNLYQQMTQRLTQKFNC